LHLDNNVSRTTDEEIRRAAPANKIAVQIIRGPASECWTTRRAETILSIYKTACLNEQDIVRMDPDVFIASPLFIEAVCRSYRGIAGKLMNLHLPALIKGKQLGFIQGGVTCWGPEGRAFLKGLQFEDIDRFRKTYEREVQGMLIEHSSL